MNKKKALLALVCAVALVTTTFFATMAYFTDTDTVTNTFTVGKVDIKLDEKNIDGKNEKGENNFSETRDKYNTYHLIPGVTHEKDPTVTIESGSEDCYVRMLVNVENIDNLKAALNDPKYYLGGNTNSMFLIQMLTGNTNGMLTWNEDKWECVSYENGTYEFRYHKMVEKGTTKLEPLFTHITVPGADVDNDEMKLLENVKINVTAHAIQAAGFETAEAAWAAWPNN